LAHLILICYSFSLPIVSVLMFNSGTCRILQEQVSNPSERGTRARAPKVPWDGDWGGDSPSPEIFSISYIKIVSFYAFPETLIDTVTALTTCFEYIHFFQKWHPNQKGGSLDTVDTPESSTAIIKLFNLLEILCLTTRAIRVHTVKFCTKMHSVKIQTNTHTTLGKT